MNNKSNIVDTEKKILEAAEIIFQKKGYDGARMQEIADNANINKGLLHYYFKTKDRLFEAIFKKAFNQIIGSMSEILTSENPFSYKVDSFIDRYMDLLLANPAIPRFVINELNKNAERFVTAMVSDTRTRPNLDAFFKSVEEEVASGNIRPIKPVHLLMNIVGLCVFPFIGKPMLQAILFIDNKEFKELMEERREEIKSFVKFSLQQ